MSKKNGDTPKGTTTKSGLNNTSLTAQRQRLLAALILSAVTTPYARDCLNIMSPATRIKELREQGHKIFTYPITIQDQNGCTHRRVARYVLIKLAEVVQ